MRCCACACWLCRFFVCSCRAVGWLAQFVFDVLLKYHRAPQSLAWVRPRDLNELIQFALIRSHDVQQIREHRTLVQQTLNGRMNGLVIEEHTRRSLDRFGSVVAVTLARLVELCRGLLL